MATARFSRMRRRLFRPCRRIDLHYALTDGILKDIHFVKPRFEFLRFP